MGEVAIRLGSLVALMLTMLGTASETTLAAASKSQLASNDMVVVARDITAESDCRWSINGHDLPCLPGTVIGDFVVPRSEAVATGESFVVYTGDRARDDPAIQKLMSAASARYATQNKEDSTLQESTLSVMSACGCNVPCSASGSYTASNFPGTPQPRIGYTAYYTVGYLNGVCNWVQVTRSETRFISTGASAAYLEFTSFNRNGGDPYNGWYPGCANIPHTSNYSTPMGGYTGYNFTNQVQSDCNWFIRRAYGYVPLN